MRFHIPNVSHSASPRFKNRTQQFTRIYQGRRPTGADGGEVAYQGRGRCRGQRSGPGRGGASRATTRRSRPHRSRTRSSPPPPFLPGLVALNRNLRQGRESKSNFRTPRCRLPAEEVNFRRVQRGLGGGVFVFVTLCFSAVCHCQPPFSCWSGSIPTSSLY